METKKSGTWTQGHMVFDLNSSSDEDAVPPQAAPAPIARKRQSDIGDGKRLQTYTGPNQPARRRAPTKLHMCGARMGQQSKCILGWNHHGLCIFDNMPAPTYTRRGGESVARERASLKRAGQEARAAAKRSCMEAPDSRMDSAYANEEARKQQNKDADAKVEKFMKLQAVKKERETLETALEKMKAEENALMEELLGA